MKIHPLRDYHPPDYPRAKDRDDALLRATPERWGQHTVVAALLVAGLTLAGLSYGPQVAERVMKLVDRAAFSLHLRQPPAALPGARIRVVPAPHTQSGTGSATSSDGQKGTP